MTLPIRNIDSNSISIINLILIQFEVLNCLKERIIYYEGKELLILIESEDTRLLYSLFYRKLEIEVQILNKE